MNVSVRSCIVIVPCHTVCARDYVGFRTAFKTHAHIKSSEKKFISHYTNLRYIILLCFVFHVTNAFLWLTRLTNQLYTSLWHLFLHICACTFLANAPSIGLLDCTFLEGIACTSKGKLSYVVIPSHLKNKTKQKQRTKNHNLFTGKIFCTKLQPPWESSCT